MATIFLDLDGTLTDPKPGITRSVVHALESLGLEAPDADSLDWVIGPPLLWSFERLGAPDPEAAVAAYRARYADVGLYENQVFDGIPELLAGLRAEGHVLHLATAKPHVYAHRITAHFGLAQHLTREFGPELDGTRNDKGELLAYALQITGARVDESVMIGDRHHDIDAARAVGMKAIGVLWGYGPREELAGADHLCAAPGEIGPAVRALLG